MCWSIRWTRTSVCGVWGENSVCTEMNPCARYLSATNFWSRTTCFFFSSWRDFAFCPWETGSGDSVCMRDFNQLNVNVFFSWPLTSESSLLRPFAMVRTLRVDDKSLPVSGLSPAHGSMPLSACHRRPVCPVNRQQINPSQQNHTVWWCFSLCSHWWILFSLVFFFFKFQWDTEAFL